MCKYVCKWFDVNHVCHVCHIAECVSDRERKKQRKENGGGMLVQHSINLPPTYQDIKQPFLLYYQQYLLYEHDTHLYSQYKYKKVPCAVRIVLLALYHVWLLIFINIDTELFILGFGFPALV